MITRIEFDEYLQSINGLISGVNGNIITSSYFFEVGDGWLDIIKSLIEELIAVGWNKKVNQVKEKFGTLRFYTGGVTDEMMDIIKKYTIISSTTCEVCGATGKIQNDNGWFSCVCETHMKNNI